MSFHVFLSYPRVADELDAVSDIRQLLEREIKLKTGEPDVVVFQDRSGLTGGDPWSEVLEDELRRADVFVLFLCPLWLTSEWCRKEMTLYLEFGKQLGVERPIVPLLWEKTTSSIAKTPEQKEMLALINKFQAVPWETLRHRDPSYPGYEEALSEFAGAIAEKLLCHRVDLALASSSTARASGTPVTSNVGRRQEKQTRLSPLPELEIIPEPGAVLAGWRLPNYRNAVFTGREDYLKKLAKALLYDPQNTCMAVPQVITCTTGIGKTQLAVEFCYRYGRYFRGCIGSTPNKI